MELPKHTCVSCGYFGETADKNIDVGHRSLILNDKLWNSAYFSFNYKAAVCSKVAKACFYEDSKTSKDIRNIIIRPNNCKDWTLCIDGMSPIATEQRESSKTTTKWAKFAFWGVVATLIIALATLIVTLAR